MDIAEKLSSVWAHILVQDPQALSHMAFAALLVLFCLSAHSRTKRGDKDKNRDSWHDNRQR